jgi:hypothetical protein
MSKIPLEHLAPYPDCWVGDADILVREEPDEEDEEEEDKKHDDDDDDDDGGGGYSE